MLTERRFVCNCDVRGGVPRLVALLHRHPLLSKCGERRGGKDYSGHGTGHLKLGKFKEIFNLQKNFTKPLVK